MKLIITAKAAAGKNHVQKDDDMHYTVWTTAVPEHGKANEAIIKLLAAHLDIPKKPAADYSRLNWSNQDNPD